MIVSRSLFNRRLKKTVTKSMIKTIFIYFRHKLTIIFLRFLVEKLFKHYLGYNPILHFLHLKLLFFRHMPHLV